MMTTPLTVLDLVPISSGSNATQALRNSIDLAQQTERLGYARYWFAEHHLNPGVAGTSPAVVLALIAGTYRSPEGEEAHVVPGEGAALQVWILGSSGGESAEVAGRNGLRFAANYHVSPATVLEAVDGYRAAFQPSAELGRPYVSVSANVVAAGTEAAARELATGYGLWVRSIRTAEGAIQFPTPEQARRHVWSEADRDLVADRIDSQFVGTPSQVADQLERLRDATEADELIITTITHDHADRVRSYQLLAEEWARR